LQLSELQITSRRSEHPCGGAAQSEEPNNSKPKEDVVSLHHLDLKWEDLFAAPRRRAVESAIRMRDGALVIRSQIVGNSRQRSLKIGKIKSVAARDGRIYVSFTVIRYSFAVQNDGLRPRFCVRRQLA
jgi:hypothetical protein